MQLSNPAAERGVIAGICRYGSESYFDVCDLINESSFTIDSNAIIYKCVKHILENDNHARIDVPSIYAAANTLSLGFVFEKNTEVKHLQSIFDFAVEQRNVRRFAGLIGRLEVARLLESQMGVAKQNLSELTGEETLAHILGIAENAIFDFSSRINNVEGPRKLGDDILDIVEHLRNNPVDQIGISTGYKHFDKAIGGGLRKATVNVIGARSKAGKTFLADNIGFHIAYNEKIPVLNVDTEMIREDHQTRSLAMLSEVSIDDVETGKFGFDPEKVAKVNEAAQKMKVSNYFHQCIGGMPFEEQIAIMRRWLVKEVGLNPDGTAKPCVIIYDYIKLMSDDSIKNMQEYQAIGFLMTSLHNFTIRYKVPVLGYIQLNRDGLTKESIEVVSQSDRVIWLCSNFSIYKKKSDEEIAMDGHENGNRKLVPIVARHGAGLDDGDYINFDMKGWCGKITEGKLHSALQNGGSQINKGGFEVKDDDDEIPFKD